VNNRIRAPEVRVIDPEGQMLGVFPIHQALASARQLELDLVEVNPKSDPPVCRIMDYGKFKYEQKKQENLAKKKRTEIELKEVKLRPKTDDHDFDFKMKHVRRFLADGNKAKITIRFRGREMAHPEVAKARFDQIISDLADVAVVEQPYRMEGRTMNIILAPKPVAQKKKVDEPAQLQPPQPPQPAQPQPPLPSPPSPPPQPLPET
jgi:translation initiation factor IF-3